MAVNLVELVKEYLTPDTVQKAAAFVGESGSATQKAINGIVPTLIAGLANQASTSGGAEKLSRMLDGGKYDGSALNNLGSLFSGGDTTQKAITQGKDALSSLFGNKTEGLVDQIARFAGLKTGSAASLLALILPLILSLLARQRSTIGQSPSALSSLLGGQKTWLSSLLPAGIASFLGWSGYERAREPEPVYVAPKRDSELAYPGACAGRYTTGSPGLVVEPARSGSRNPGGGATRRKNDRPVASRRDEGFRSRRLVSLQPASVAGRHDRHNSAEAIRLR
jgi:hypothetical protein